MRYAREQAGLTQAKLAEACGVAFSLISEIERGTRNATPAMLIKMAAVLNCPRVVLERKRNQCSACGSTVIEGEEASKAGRSPSVPPVIEGTPGGPAAG
ncbi:helix-turn-helix domain-containing protein [Actinomadura sp. SCN-SB]|uniref:helix-turn-helix domain-containing protein n=1 Tax=Actinomadura sp. SCN-SB TaxID=3373092 RepID=UPI0037500CBF